MDAKFVAKVIWMIITGGHGGKSACLEPGLFFVSSSLRVQSLESLSAAF